MSTDQISRRKFIFMAIGIAVPIIVGGFIGCNEAGGLTDEGYDPQHLKDLYATYESFKLGDAKKIGGDGVIMYFPFPKASLMDFKEPPYRSVVLKWIQHEGRPMLKTCGVDIVEIQGDAYLGSGEFYPGEILIINPNEFIVELFEKHGKKYSVASYLHEK
ncbi:MAG: hypothetical protein ABIA75_10425 [Candidatus Neomarinimicrobiota bacterium]